MAETNKKKVDPNLEKVKVKFPKIRGNRNPDVVIIVNGKTWQIRRGETVEVPKYVLKAYDNNERNREAAEAYIIEQSSNG